MSVDVNARVRRQAAVTCERKNRALLQQDPCDDDDDATDDTFQDQDVAEFENEESKLDEKFEYNESNQTESDEDDNEPVKTIDEKDSDYPVLSGQGGEGDDEESGDDP